MQAPTTTLKRYLAAAAFIITTAVATTLHGAIIAMDSFDGGYTIGTGLKNFRPSNSTGFTNKTWGKSNSTGVFFVNDGLSLPSDFAAEASGNGIGVGKFSADPSGSNPYGRRISRPFDTGVIPNEGTFYLRFACAISEEAELFLSQNHFEALGLVPEALDNTDAIGTIPTIGIHFGFIKTGAKNSTGTKLVSYAAGNILTNLVDTVVAGKTYLVAAKIEIDSSGTASVSAIAGASDDASLRTATLPEPVSANVGTTALGYLCLSGVYMTGYANGKWATFDEFAVGENLSDVFSFIEQGAPVISATGQDSITETGFTAYGALTQLGDSSPEVFFDISSDGGETWSPSSLGTFTETDDSIAHSASDLLSGTTYSWRLRAIGSTAAATSTVFQVTTSGAPVFGAVSAFLIGNDVTFSVALDSPGLSGKDETTVEFWCAEEGNELTKAKTFDSTTVAGSFSETMEDLAWGETYRYAFSASIPYNGGYLIAWTATNSIEIVGDIEWTAASTTDWHTSGNWSPEVVPTALLTAKFADVGGTVTADNDAFAATINIDTTGDGVTLNMNENALTADYLHLGATASESKATLLNGSYSFSSSRVGAAATRRGNLTVGQGATFTAGDLYIGQDQDTGSASNSITFASGSVSEVTGTLFLRSARGGTATVSNGALLTIGSELNLFGNCVKFIVDGGVVTNRGQTILLKSNTSVLSEPLVMELRNGAYAYMSGITYVNAGKNTSGGFYNAELRILSGSTFETPSALHIDAADTRVSPDADHGYGAKVIVSNATLKSGSMPICADSRHHDDKLLIYEDDGESALVQIKGNLRIANESATRDPGMNCNNCVEVAGGDLTVSGTFFIGDHGKNYALCTNNYLRISRANSAVSANALTVYGTSHVDFDIPETGFDEVPLSITGEASFGTISTGFDSATYIKATEIRVDARKFNGTQTLLTARSITGLDEDRVIVDAPTGAKVNVILDGTSLTVKVSRGATTIIMR